MKLKNRIFLILVIFFIVLLGMITNSYCAFEVEMSDGKKLAFENPPNDGNPDFFIWYVNTDAVNNSYFYLTYNSIYCNVGFLDGESPLVCFDKNTGSWFAGINVYIIKADKLDGSFTLLQEKQTSFGVDLSSTSFYSSKNIYDCHRDSNRNFVLGDKLLFQGAPLPIPMVEPMEVSKVEELPTLIIQIVEMIIPAFLIIFGTLLVLYLIKSKNLLNL